MAIILVVDDAPICREPIAAALRLAGHRTLTASNGQEAIWVIENKRPDLVLLDIAMPVMDGIATLRKMRGRDDMKDIPVVLLTAVTDAQYLTSAAEMRPEELLLKSQFSLPEMLARVEKCLKRQVPMVCQSLA